MPSSAVLALALLLPAQADRPTGPPKDDFKPDPAWKALDKSNALWFDPKERRLILRARVCLREGYLEHLLCSDRTKEHESILATPASARMIHAGLLLTGAKEGHPVRYRPKFEAPTGEKMRVTLEWAEGGRAKSSDARDWVLDEKKKKTLAESWVFAGSEQFPDPQDPKKILYAAEQGGDLFTVANFTAAILDVPFASSGSDAERSFVANTAKIPPKDTFVTMIIRPETPAPAAAPKP